MNAAARLASPLAIVALASFASSKSTEIAPDVLRSSSSAALNRSSNASTVCEN